MTSYSRDYDGTTNSTIQTFTGEMFDVFNPQMEHINLKDISHALSMLCRYGGHCREFYSVAEHCVLMAGHFEKSGEPELARAALLHDATEAYMGDVVRPLKSQLPLYRDVENRLQRLIFLNYGVYSEVPKEVKIADLCITTDEREMLLLPRPWSIDPVEPLGVELQCWTHDQAEQAWLDSYWRLFP